MLVEKARDLHKKFQAVFHTGSNVYRAPGRVNLIGEHTDYNGGLVMPAAIELSCWAAVGPRTDRKLAIVSENFGESFEADLDGADPSPSGKWWEYAVGIAWVLEKSGNRLRGANLYIHGEVPIGAGLSSSAAIEVCVGLALSDLSGYRIDRTRLALMCQTAENEYTGAHCGIMDQFASAHGRARHALFLDCRSLEYDLIPIPKTLRLVICDTSVRRDLVSSEYNNRRVECEEGAATLARVLPDVRELRDVSLQDLEKHRSLLTPTIYKRCHHVITENDRVVRAATAFRGGAMDVVAELMAESHRSLRDDFEVSSAELDLMVKLALEQRGVHGARMTGAGFGGCTINLVEAEHAFEFQKNVREAYRSLTGRDAGIYVCESSDGAERVASSTVN